MDKLLRQLGHRYIFDDAGLVYISSEKPTYGMVWLPGIWSYQFPDEIHMQARRLVALTELLQMGLIDEAQAKQMVGL